jgi:hypothetical protein
MQLGDCFLKEMNCVNLVLEANEFISEVLNIHPITMINKHVGWSPASGYEIDFATPVLEPCYKESSDI